MHAHTKPAAKLSAAMNNTALTNDQRNRKIDRAMPVRATLPSHVPRYTSPPAAPPSCQAVAFCSTKASEQCTQPHATQMNDMPRAFSQSLSQSEPAGQGEKATMLQVRHVPVYCLTPHPASARLSE